MRGYTVLDLSLNARVVREGILYVAHTQMEEEHNTPIHILGRSAGGSAITLYLFTRSSEIFVERPSSELKPSTAIYFPIWNLTHSHTHTHTEDRLAIHHSVLHFFSGCLCIHRNSDSRRRRSLFIFYSHSLPLVVRSFFGVVDDVGTFLWLFSPLLFVRSSFIHE